LDRLPRQNYRQGQRVGYGGYRRGKGFVLMNSMNNGQVLDDEVMAQARKDWDDLQAGRVVSTAEIDRLSSEALQLLVNLRFQHKRCRTPQYRLSGYLLGRG
jgi:hypothetical protein